jgi:sarcosine oxidase subunit gamma
MVERVSPLAGVALPRSAGLRVAEVPFLTQVNLRLSGKGPAADVVGVELGVPLPVEPGTLARAAGVTVLWLGPDEWLVVGDPDTGLEQRIRAAVGEPAGEPLSIVDVSAARTTVLVAGDRARDLLAHGCALDLHPSRFPAGRCAQTMLAQAAITLVCVDPEPAYWLLVRTSFARYLADWLVDAAAEFG